MHTPLTVDLRQMTPVNTPEDFRFALTQPKINVLPLVRDPKAPHDAGWCTYTYEHEQAPELEVICGGINHKTPRAGAIWRQGHLLHFGFAAAPDQMTEAGQALLVNAICYIARFTEDRPVVHTPCVFVQGKRIFDRGAIARLVTEPERDLKSLKYYVDKPTYAKLADKSREEVGKWYQGVAGYLHADAEGLLTVDADAQGLGIEPNQAHFFEQAAAALGEPGHESAARRLLARYAPDGPGAGASANAWHAWAKENRPYLFFSDTGGYRWYVDPLAKRRGVPTAKLRGPARATRPSVPATEGQRK